MKVYINTTEDWDSIKEAVVYARKYFKGYITEIKLNKINLDLSIDGLEFIYETTYSWSWFKKVQTRSIKGSFIRNLAPKEYDYAGLIVDKNVTLQDGNLYGQHSSKDKSIEVYAKKRGVLRGLPYTTNNLVHELNHAVCSHYGIEDNLHEFIDKNKNMVGFLPSKTKSKINDIFPLVKKKFKALQFFAKLLGTPIKMVEGYRSAERQNELYKQRPKVTNAKGGESMHQYGIALDYCFAKGVAYPPSGDSKWRNVNNMAKWLGFYSYGLELGWDDGHIQVMFDYSERDFRNGNVDYSKYE